MSVLLPSRGRPDLLARSVASLLDQASTPGRVEVLVAADTDDVATLEATAELPVHVVECEPLGYGRLHEYVNRLADVALGDWCMLWNDDATMRTGGWDDIVAGEPAGVLQCRDGHRDNTFPIVPTNWVRRLGHFSLHRANDSWWEAIGAGLGEMRRVPIRVEHQPGAFSAYDYRGFLAMVDAVAADVEALR